MNRIFAEFISPTVSHIHHSDPTINFINLSEFVNNKKHSHKINEIFEELVSENFLTQILNLSEGNSIEIENDQIIRSIRYFSILVNNEELFNKINEHETTNKKDEKNINELLEEIEFLYEMNPTFNGHRYLKLIDDISSKISKSQSKEMNLKKVPKCILKLDYRELTSDLWSKLCEILVNHKEENKSQETKENQNRK